MCVNPSHCKPAAEHRNTLQPRASHSTPLQHTAAHCNTLQHTATHMVQAGHWCHCIGKTCAITRNIALHPPATCCNTMQHAATHVHTLCRKRIGALALARRTLKPTANHYDMLQRTATCCNLPCHTATHCNKCNALHSIGAHCSTLHRILIRILQDEARSQRIGQTRPAIHCRPNATHCHTLQHTATHCNTLQDIATHCNTLPHTAPHVETHCTG